MRVARDAKDRILILDGGSGSIHSMDSRGRTLAPPKPRLSSRRSQ